MAYFVARTQREIAENKYNLDLFDKRYPLYEEFDKEYTKTIKNDVYTLYSNYHFFSYNNKTLIMKISKMFSNTKEDCMILIDSPNVLYDKIKEFSVQHEIRERDIEQTLKNYSTIESKFQKIDGEIKRLNEAGDTISQQLALGKITEKSQLERQLKELAVIKELSSKIDLSFKTVFEKMNEQLDISHNAYIKPEYYSFKNMIYKPYIIIKKIRW